MERGHDVQKVRPSSGGGAQARAARQAARLCNARYAAPSRARASIRAAHAFYDVESVPELFFARYVISRAADGRAAVAAAATPKVATLFATAEMFDGRRRKNWVSLIQRSRVKPRQVIQRVRQATGHNRYNECCGRYGESANQLCGST